MYKVSELVKKEHVNPKLSAALFLIVRESSEEILQIASFIHQSEISPWGRQPFHTAL